MPECYIPRQVLDWRARLQLYHDLRVEHSSWAKRIHATCFHQGATALGEAGVIRGDRQRLLAIIKDQLTAAGRLQANTALSIMDTLAEHIDRVRHGLLDSFRHIKGARALMADI